MKFASALLGMVGTTIIVAQLDDTNPLRMYFAVMTGVWIVMGVMTWRDIFSREGRVSHHQP